MQELGGELGREWIMQEFVRVFGPNINYAFAARELTEQEYPGEQKFSSGKGRSVDNRPAKTQLKTVRAGGVTCDQKGEVQKRTTKKSMNDNKLDESTPKPSKTFLVRYGLLSVGADEDTREGFHLGLVEARNLEAAIERAWKAHCPEASDAEDDGNETSHNGHRAYQLSAEHCDVDANSIFWLDKIAEVPAADVPVLIKYL